MVHTEPSPGVQDQPDIEPRPNRVKDKYPSYLDVIFHIYELLMHQQYFESHIYAGFTVKGD